MKKKITLHEYGFNSVLGEGVMDVPDGTGNISAEPYYFREQEISPVTLVSIKEILIERLNNAADAARRRELPGDPGGLLTYQMKLDEAHEYKSVGGVPADYPFLEGEIAAYAAIGTTYNLNQVSNGLIAREATWLAAYAAIERIRRIAWEEGKANGTAAGATAIVEQAIVDLEAV